MLPPPHPWLKRSDTISARSSSSSRPSYRQSNVTPGILAFLPLVLLGGIGLGFLIPRSNATVDNLNVININGTTLTNSFVPMNTATATNDNNDADTINVMTGKRRRRRGLEEDKESWTEYIGEILIPRAMWMLGTSEARFAGDLVRSSASVGPGDVFGQLSSLSRKLFCLDKDKSAVSDSCADLAACEHLAEDNLVFNGNLIIRAGELFLLTLRKWGYDDDSGIYDVGAMSSAANAGDCHVRYSCEEDNGRVEECMLM